MPDARVAFYGDDFTGSVDALLQFARRGWQGRLFTSLPDDATLGRAAAEVDVIGVAGIARSLGTEALDAEVRPVFEAFARLRPRLVQYKACSTADSSPTLGSLGRIVEIGRSVFGDRPVPMLFAQPDFGRYTAFGHHFAAEGGTVHRLDRQPTMSTHPATPMTESDLARHLSAQTTERIGSIPFTAFDDLPARLAEADAAAVVLDTLDDTHLTTIGRALGELADPVFAVGSGGLSHGVAAAAPVGSGTVATTTSTPGAVLAVSGSRSAQTRRQMDAAAAAGWEVRPLPLHPDAAIAVAGDVCATLAAGRSVALTADDADLAGVGSRPVLTAIAEAATSVVGTAVRAGATRRVVVCGGDTSSRVTRMLGVEALSILANPWGNVVVLRAHASEPGLDGVELLLKGGQVGAASLLPDLEILPS